ncbi:MAG TPA: hypothetical protein VGN16_21350 [Acidobacteriaceae bacterium]
MTNATALLTARHLRMAACTLLTSVLAFGFAAAGAQTAAPGTKAANSKQIAPVVGPHYNDKWELYGGLNFMNGQAGQNLPKRYNMGGGEVMATYWLGPRLGIVGDYRIGAGTTPVFPNQFNLNRVLIRQNIFSGGVQWRGPKNRYASLDYHALGGATRGTFDSAIKGFPAGGAGGGQAPTVDSIGVYSNRTSAWAAVGGSVDFNYSPRLAIRLQPDLTMEHFGTELREFFAISGGVVYRFGQR